MARFIRNYEIVKELGSGRYGSVFMAVGEVPGRGLSAGKRRLVALKRLKEHNNPEAARLMQQEFDLLDQVKHRGIVRVYEYIEEEQTVVMELVHGVTLREMLDECDRAHEQVFTEAAVEIACELADALYQAYTTPGDNGEPLQLVHRDLKPENVMLTPQGEVKILDFGLARVDNTDFASEDPSRIRGTPIYMAPEQARGEAVDHRTDLFALGLISYELLMGHAAYRVPENSPDPVAAAYDAIEQGRLDDCVAELEKKLPGMGPVIARCLQARPNNRYKNGQELLVDLRRQLFRDRGAFLQEFCEFFFGNIYELEDLPSIDDFDAPSSGRGGRGRRMSIEERLRQSMEREKLARKSKPSSGQGGADSVGDPPATPRRRAPRSRAKPFEPPPKVDRKPEPAPSSRSSGRRSGGRSQDRPRMVGAHSPDETGMLEMVPLGAGSDMPEEVEDPSATAFFAIPAPKSEPPQPSGPSGLPGPSAPPPSAAPPPPPPSQPAYSPPGGSSGGAAPPPPSSIQGPVASGPQAGGQSPFEVASQQEQPPPSADSGQRVQSNRVYAVILGIVALVGAAIVAAIWIPQSTEPPTTTGGGGTTTEDPPSDPPPVVEDDPPKDTGEPEPDPPKPRNPPPRTTTQPAKPAEPEPPSGPSPITVRMTDGGAGIFSVEVICNNPSFRKKVSMSGGNATVPDVPQASCTVYFKGAVNAKFYPVSGGQSLSCRIQGTTAVCS